MDVVVDLEGLVHILIPLMMVELLLNQIKLILVLHQETQDLLIMDFLDLDLVFLSQLLGAKGVMLVVVVVLVVVIQLVRLVLFNQLVVVMDKLML